MKVSANRNWADAAIFLSSRPSVNLYNMLRQSERSVKACDVITVAASLEPMEGKTETGKANTQPDIAYPFNSGEDEEDELQDDIYEFGTSRKPARKRRKIEPSSPSTANGKKKNLSLLPTMPLDILFEIFGHLSPKDILNVSRASKTFRETLTTRRATTVWKAARHRIGAPECPRWVSEPAWAALLFGHICQSCGTSHVHKVDFLLLKRVCASCKKTHLLICSKAARRYRRILDLVPSTNVSAWCHGHAGKNSYYWDTDLETMAERVSNLEADVQKELPNSQKILLDFKEEHKQRLTQIQQASPEWRAWSHAVQLEHDRERREAQNKRIEQIKEKFRELGYTNEDLSFMRYLKECYSTAPLTKKGWKSIRPKLEPQLMERKADRLQKEASKIQGIRRQIIHSRYKEYQRTLHPSRWKYIPQTLEIMGYEPFARHVNAPVEAEVTAATFDDAFAYFPQLMIAAMEERKTSLRDLLPRDENSGANHDPMDLATAAFRCEEEDSVFLFGWDEIASHHCREQDGVLNYNADLQPKTTTPSVGYSPLAANVIKKVIDVVGWDCATATPSELDNRDLRFSCDSCGSHTEGGWIHYEVGYDWRTLATHLCTSPESHNPNFSITILSGREAEEVRRCQRSDKRMESQWTCTHCPEHLDNLQTRHVVLQHLRDSHDILVPFEPTDLLFVERCRKESMNPPKFTIHKVGEPAPLFRCLLCPKDTTSDSVYILPNIEHHMKKIHQIVDAEIGLDFEGCDSDVLEQPLMSICKRYEVGLD